MILAKIAPPPRLSIPGSATALIGLTSAYHIDQIPAGAPATPFQSEQVDDMLCVESILDFLCSGVLVVSF